MTDSIETIVAEMRSHSANRTVQDWADRLSALSAVPGKMGEADVLREMQHAVDLCEKSGSNSLYIGYVKGWLQRMTAPTVPGHVGDGKSANITQSDALALLDAARYRWLCSSRRNDCDYQSLEDKAWYELQNGTDKWKLDVCIDAAMGAPLAARQQPVAATEAIVVPKEIYDRLPNKHTVTVNDLAKAAKAAASTSTQREEDHSIQLYPFAALSAQPKGDDTWLLDAKVICIDGRDEFGEPLRTLHMGIDLRKAIRLAIEQAGDRRDANPTPPAIDSSLVGDLDAPLTDKLAIALAHMPSDERLREWSDAVYNVRLRGDGHESYSLVYEASQFFLHYAPTLLAELRRLRDAALSGNQGAVLVSRELLAELRDDFTCSANTARTILVQIDKLLATELAAKEGGG